MNLEVLNNSPRKSKRPWFAEGLAFTCSQCGNCCTGGPGYVWASTEEIRRVAEYLKLTPEEVVEKYCRTINGKISFTERRRGNLHDCIFLVEEKVEHKTPEGDIIRMTRRGCSIYPVRPLQCRTWPFWPENLQDIDAWNDAARKCHGMNHGDRVFTRQQIESIRDATDWPENPPTSGDQ